MDSLDVTPEQHEGDSLAVWRPGGVLVIGVVVSQLRRIRSIGVHGEQLLSATDHRDEHHTFSIGGERGICVD
jgi:hypothetical protein